MIKNVKLCLLVGILIICFLYELAFLSNRVNYLHNSELIQNWHWDFIHMCTIITVLSFI